MRNLLLCCAALALGATQAWAGLIVNGDFSLGNTGFATSYTYSPTDIGPARTYAIVADPSDARPNDINPVSYKDHTTGTGLMMAVNGASVPNTLVWSQTVSVAAGSEYDFSLWVSSWFGPPVAQLDVLFNGVSIGTPSAPATTAIWQEFSATWNSGLATSVKIDIVMTNAADVGGDFALDDISLTGPAVPEPGTIAMALSGAGLLGLGWLRRKRPRS